MLFACIAGENNLSVDSEDTFLTRRVAHILTGIDKSC